MNRKQIEQYGIGQYVETTDLRISGRIIKIMPRKKTVRIVSSEQCLIEIPFGTLVSVCPKYQQELANQLSLEGK